MRELAPLPVPLDAGEKTGRLLWLHRACPSATLDKAISILISVILSFSTLPRVNEARLTKTRQSVNILQLFFFPGGSLSGGWLNVRRNTVNFAPDVVFRLLKSSDQ